MAKKQEEQQEQNALAIVAWDMDLEPIDLHAEMERVGLLGEKVKAKDLVGQQFVIYRVKAFDSAFQGTDHAYFCSIKLDPAGPFYTCVFGGQAIVDLLDFYVGTKQQNPLLVTLGWVEGGAYGGYYVFV
jgi:hypothetical protein